VRSALDFIAGRTCTAITSKTGASQQTRASRQLLTPDQPTVAQREVVGLF
jgi:hypothetical protein